MLLALATLAMAGGDADIELLPSLASEVVPGVPENASWTRGTVRANLAVQYELNPLVASEEDVEFGSVIKHRVGSYLAVQVTPAKRVALDLALPIAAQFGSDVGYLSGDGFGLGDAVLGVNLGIQNSDASDIGLRVGIHVPTSTKEKWTGERGVRGTASLSGRVGTSIVAGWSIGGTFRDATNKDEFLALGTELFFSAGIRVPVGIVEPLVFAAGRTSTRGVVDGSSTFAIEPGAGARVNVSDQWALMGTVGRGVTKGYGATDLRARLTVTFRKAPADDIPPIVEVINIPDPPDELDIVFEPEPEPEPPPAPPTVQITQQIQFPLNRDVIPPAMATQIDEVAAMMLVNQNIDHVVIEGRASDEASYSYNYDLSERRAQAVFQALVKKGIHPDRLSYRAMGEVRATGSADPNDRIVTFEVTRYVPTPTQRAPVAKPWNGEAPR